MSEDKRLAATMATTAAARAALALAAGNEELAQLWADAMAALRKVEHEGGRTVNPMEAA